MKDKITLLFGCAAVLFITLAIVGAVQAYSPVPFWDMWDGYLGFYTAITSGDIGALWAQHNEHRLVLSNLLFYADIAWFQGTGLFLIVVNYVLASLIALVFWLIWNEQAVQDAGYVDNRFIGFFLLAWLFSWSQHDNLTWAFQSQFFLAQLLPLAAFYFLHRAIVNANRSDLFFSLAVLCGLLAVGSMANGILVLPLLLVFALLTHMSWRRILLLFALSLATVMLYFHGYQSPQGHDSLIKALQSNPVGLAEYVLLYLGAPLSYLLGHGIIAKVVGLIAGFLFLLLVFSFAWRIFQDSKPSTSFLALLVFILYVCITALGTAGGRLIFGVDQSMSSRYETPTIMAWAALLILYLPAMESSKLGRQKKLWIPFLILLLMMIPQQIMALDSNKNKLFEQKVAALALELGVVDQQQIGHIYPSAAIAISLSKAPIAQNLSIFGLYPIKGSRDLLNTVYKRATNIGPACLGDINEVNVIVGDPRFLRVSGWFFDPRRTGNRLGSVLLVNKQGTIVGIALTGQLRTDTVDTLGRYARDSGFEGYLLANNPTQTIQLIDRQSGCHTR